MTTEQQQFLGYFYIFLAALIWGSTNPLLKRCVEDAAKRGRSQWRHAPFVVAQLLNWTGSIAFFFALQHNKLSIATTAVNGLTFAVTELVSVWVMRSVHRAPAEALRVYAGVVLILVGILIQQI